MEQEFRQLEGLRQNALRRIWILVAIEIVVFFVVLYIFHHLVLFFFFGVLTGILYWCFGGLKPMQVYIYEVKSLLIGETFGNHFERIQANYEGGYKRENLRETELISMGNRYESDDLVSGFYKGVSFSRADVYIADESHDSNGGSSTTVYMKGRWMIFRFPKKMGNDLQIISSGFHYANRKSGIFTKKIERRHKVQMESATFNKSFEVWANQDADAFYVLTPHMMEKIMTYCSRMDGKVMLGLIDNNLHVLINNKKNTMEPNVFRKPDYDKMMSEINTEIDLIKYTIDLFSLDQEHFQGII